MSFLHIPSLLGRQQAKILLYLAERQHPVIAAKATYLSVVVDLSAGIAEIDITETCTFFLASCACCGDAFANRVRIKSRNSLFSPLDTVRNGATEKSWNGDDCASCRAKKFNRERAARHRDRNRSQPAAVPCSHCGESFTPKRSTAAFCSTRCRVAAHRAKG